MIRLCQNVALSQATAFKATPLSIKKGNGTCWISLIGSVVNFITSSIWSGQPSSCQCLWPKRQLQWFLKKKYISINGCFAVCTFLWSMRKSIHQHWKMSIVVPKPMSISSCTLTKSSKFSSISTLILTL